MDITLCKRLINIHKQEFPPHPTPYLPLQFVLFQGRFTNAVVYSCEDIISQ